MCDYDPHPCHGLQVPHHEAFERVIIGATPLTISNIPTTPAFQRQIIGTLLHRGLIARNANGAYYVPTQPLKQWCAWCDEQETSK